MLWLQVERLRKSDIKGAFAELGVYKGETARMIHAMDPQRKFYLLDTFEGFDSADLEAETLRKENSRIDFSDTALEPVRDFVQGNENVIYVKGLFPASASVIDEPFALVHLDVDLYLPTKAALRFFYPRLVPGGVIIVHDYHHTWDGIKKAVDEFMPTINESLIAVPDWQGSVMIIKNS
jgi:O-methyltransferase